MGRILMKEKSDSREIDALIRGVVQKYGYENVILNSQQSLAEAGRILEARRQVIQEVMGITSLGYGGAYTRLEMALRHYKRGRKGVASSMETIWLGCAICGKPVATVKIRKTVLCSFHRFHSRRIYHARCDLREKRGLVRRRRVRFSRLEGFKEAAETVNELVDDAALAELLELEQADREKYRAAWLAVARQVSVQSGMRMMVAEAILGEVLGSRASERWKQLSMF
jgi:hypothetical protein